jgi:hypothetical protein
MLQVLEEHVENRGLALSEGTLNSRRPRLVVYSTERTSLAMQADTILRMDPETLNVLEIDKELLGDG